MYKFLNFLLTSFVLIFALVSCGESSTLDGGNQKEFITDAAPEEDSLVVMYISFTPEIGLELEKYFTLELCKRLDLFVDDFNHLESDTDFEANYREGRALLPVLYDNLYEPTTSYLIALAEDEEYWSPMETVYNDLAIFKDVLGPIEISCAAECTEVDFLFDLNKMLNAAKKTKGKGDDEFMELLVFVDGDYGYAGYPGFKAWLLQTWDYGGATLLGDGILLEAINKSIDYKNKFNLFDEELALVREDIINGLTWEVAFQYSPEKVLAEFDKILALKFFNKTELVDIMKLYNRIKALDTDLQFDCENQDCSYG